jgi:hypothetical protein
MRKLKVKIFRTDEARRKQFRYDLDKIVGMYNENLLTIWTEHWEIRYLVEVGEIALLNYDADMVTFHGDEPSRSEIQKAKARTFKRTGKVFHGRTKLWEWRKG